MHVFQCVLYCKYLSILGCDASNLSTLVMGLFQHKLCWCVCLYMALAHSVLFGDHQVFDRHAVVISMRLLTGTQLSSYDFVYSFTCRQQVLIWILLQRGLSSSLFLANTLEGACQYEYSN